MEPGQKNLSASPQAFNGLRLSQDQMAMLFGKARNTITEHIQSVFKEGELNEEWYVGISDIPLFIVLLKGKHRKLQ